MRMEARGLGQAALAGQLCRGHYQPRTRQAASVVVQINAHHAIEGVLDDSLTLPVRVLRGRGRHDALQSID